ncbi:MAG: hypothetical protein LBS17_06790, partial [Actinomycetes bacterium]|nr:hypothetical protein [Actinomycetes bacterium]
MSEVKPAMQCIGLTTKHHRRVLSGLLVVLVAVISMLLGVQVQTAQADTVGFTAGGIYYKITSLSPAQVQVGNGVSVAIATNTTGTITI